MREILEETQNRELSWLRFNQRVLEEARDETVPLMERMKFVAIFTSNLDEFFMIRVGSLYDMAAADSKKIDQRSGMTAKQQLDAGAVYLDVNIGPAENDGEDIMKWAVELLQSNFDNVPLALDTSNKKAIEAGISVYNRSKGKPIVNSADAAGRIENIDLAAANDAIVIALCNGEGIAKDNDERMGYCQMLLERGLEHGMEAEDLWFDPLFLVVKGMQDKQMQVLECIKMFSDMGLNSTGGLSNNSNGMPKAIRPIMDSALVAMAMMQGLTSAIVNPNDLRLMETIKSCDVFKRQYSVC